jgi:DnaJ family protein A protein 5
MGNTASSGGKERTTTLKKDGPKCYYELLGVNMDATPEELKKAYRQKALLCHPGILFNPPLFILILIDKNPHRLEEAHHEFATIQAAWEVLSDPQERAFYDRHRSSILAGDRRRNDEEALDLDDLMKYFSPTAYEGFGDGPRGFFTVFRELFEYLEEFEAEEEQQQSQHYRRGHYDKPAYTSFGSKNIPYEPMVRQFYEKWLHFSSNRKFEEVDRYQPAYHDNRRMRRAMYKENVKERDKLKREFSGAVQELAAYVRKRDPRYISYQKERAEQRERDEVERRTREKSRREEEVANFVEQEWAKVEHDRFTKAADEFWNEPEDDNDEEEVESSENEEYYCAPCKKLFRKRPQWKNHEKSKKHRSTLMAMGIDPDEEVAEELVEKSTGELTEELVDELEDGQDNDSSIETFGNVERVSESIKSMSFADDGLPSLNHPPSSANIPDRKTKKSRRAADRNKTVPTDEGHRCNVCGESFTSRNQLFHHVKEQNHALAASQSKKR